MPVRLRRGGIFALSGNQGAASVARARPGGYTILLGGTLPHVNEASRPLYDPVKDLDPIAGLAVIALALAVHPSVPAQNLKELVAYAKTHAGKLSYAHVGVGSTPQLIGEMFKLQAGLPELVQGPYRGAGPAIADLISGQVAMAVVAVTVQSLGFHRSGQLRILAVTSPKRLIAAPELPTVAEGSSPA
jgi:tripartite-type tricarboxylate transporter receptor subunit TctC